MSEKQSTVSVLLQRRGSVSAGPLTLKPGLNEVSETDFLEFRKTKLGAALVKQRVVQYAPEPVEDYYEPPKSEVSASTEDPNTDPPNGDEGGDPAPTLAMSAKEAVKYVSTLDNIEELGECYKQDGRKTVQAACIARAEELSDDGSDDGSDEPDPGVEDSDDPSESSDGE